MKETPLVSIVTPSFNQGDFLEATIQSVLAQDYPAMEYGIMDGGSTDSSLEIIKRYEADLDWWLSEPDRGQADAINKGMARLNGEIVTWLNSDDIYFPGTIKKAVREFQSSNVGMVYGDAITMNARGVPLNHLKFGNWELSDLLRFKMICQPAVFIKKAVWDDLGGLDATYHFMLDHHLWIRIAAAYEIKHVSDILAGSRYHQQAKNVASAADFSKEIFRVAEFASQYDRTAERFREDRRRILGGAYRLSARYLLDGKRPFQAMTNYLKALIRWPADAIKYWPRILFSVVSLVTGLQTAQLQKRRAALSAPLLKELQDWPGIKLPSVESNQDRAPTAMKPILVTGAHRSGTTWVGKIIATADHITYISEPLHVQHSRGILSVPVDHWYTYICDENQSRFLKPYRDTMNFRFRTYLALSDVRSWRDVAKLGNDFFSFMMAQFLNHQPLLKDPFAIFSAPWFHNTFDAQVVITVRHPLAFVSSLKRLGWTFNFNNFLNQPLLMRDHLEGFREEMLEIKKNQDDIIRQGILLWKAIHSVVKKYQEQYDDFIVLRHEDLSTHPTREYSKLFDHLEMEYTPEIVSKIEETTQSHNPPELPPDQLHAVHLDSKENLKNWRKRLTDPEVEQVLDGTEGQLFGFYEQGEWRKW